MRYKNFISSKNFPQNRHLPRSQKSTRQAALHCMTNACGFCATLDHLIHIIMNLNIYVYIIYILFVVYSYNFAFYFFYKKFHETIHLNNRPGVQIARLTAFVFLRFFIYIYYIIPCAFYNKDRCNFHPIRLAEPNE